MPSDGIADALNTTFVPSDAPEEFEDDEMHAPARIEPLKVDADIVKAEKVDDNFDGQESVYVKEKLKIMAEKAEMFFAEMRDEFKQAPTAKMAESAGKALETAIKALDTLAKIDEDMKKRKFAREKERAKNAPVPTAPMQAGGDIHVTQNNIYANREDILSAIRKNNNAKKAEADTVITDVEVVK
jgi:hypothetical protein